MPAPDSDSDDLLRFVRETPLTFGSWRDVKSLYKRLEADPSASPLVLAALINRLDSASLVADRDTPTAAMGLSYNTGMPESVAVRGTRMAVVALGWQSSGLYLYDFGTPDALKPKTLGKLTQKGRGDWQEVVFAGDDLLCVRTGGSQLRLYSIAGGKPTERGALLGRAGSSTNEVAAQSGGIGFLAAAEQMIKGAFGVDTSPAADSAVEFANVSSIAAEGNYVYAACGAAGGKKPSSLGGICVVNVSDPDNPQLAATIAIEDAERVVLVPGRGLAAVLANPRNRGRQTQGSIYLVDISNPLQPKIVSVMAFAHGSTLTAAQNYLYVSALNAGYRGTPDAGRVIDITNERAPRIAGAIPVASYYGIEHMAYRDGIIYVGMRYGRLNVIDVRDPDKPLKVRELAPSYVKSLSIVGDRMYSGIGHSMALWSLQTPEHPTLIGMPPSAATLGYMKRRARRLLKNLAKSDPALFTTIAAAVLSGRQRGFGAELGCQLGAHRPAFRRRRTTRSGKPRSRTHAGDRDPPTAHPPPRGARTRGLECPPGARRRGLRERQRPLAIPRNGAEGASSSESSGAEAFREPAAELPCRAVRSSDRRSGATDNHASTDRHGTETGACRGGVPQGIPAPANAPACLRENPCREKCRVGKPFRGNGSSRPPGYRGGRCSPDKANRFRRDGDLWKLRL
jgi:hypothetical protein